MPRIIAGRGRGRRLAAPPGDATRPTADRVREALFSSLLAEAASIDGWSVLDLYAGSGAVGLEALSRGAAHATFVESSRQVAAIIRTNAATAQLAPADVIAAKVSVFLNGPLPVSAPYDFVFADPPYDIPDAEVDAALAALTQPGWLTPNAIVVVERGTRRGELRWPHGLVALRSRRYGDGTLWYARLAGSDSENGGPRQDPDEGVAP